MCTDDAVRFLGFFIIGVAGVMVEWSVALRKKTPPDPVVLQATSLAGMFGIGEFHAEDARMHFRATHDGWKNRPAYPERSLMRTLIVNRTAAQLSEAFGVGSPPSLMLDHEDSERLDQLLTASAGLFRPEFETVSASVRKVIIDAHGYVIAEAFIDTPDSFIAEFAFEYVVIHNPHLEWSDHIDIDGELVNAHIPIPAGDEVPSEVITEALVSDGWQVHTAWFGPFAIVSRWPVN